MSDEEWGASVAADLARAIGDPRFPVLSALLTEQGQVRSKALTAGGGLMDALDQGFDLGLQRVLDGIQSYMDARAAKAARARARR